MDKATAMNREEAVKQRDRLVWAGVPKEALRIRNRSWDTEGVYFAVDVKALTNPPIIERKLYKPADVDAYLNSYTLAVKPVDVEPYMTSKRAGTVAVYQFRVGGTYGDYLVAPDGSFWWTEADMRKVGGIATRDGKRYRMGRSQFVPFVQ